MLLNSKAVHYPQNNIKHVLTYTFNVLNLTIPPKRLIISINEISEALEVSKQTANTLVKEFEEKNILTEITGYQRNKLFVFKRYLDIYSQL